MSLEQVFSTPPIPYRTIAQRVATGLVGGLFAGYNPYLVTPPRTYPEALTPNLGCQAFWVTRVVLPDSYTQLNLLLWENQIYWPSWNVVLQTFDATSGAPLSTTDVQSSVVGPIWVAYTKYIVAAFDGSLWRNELNLALTQIDPVTLAVTQGPFAPSLYTGLSVGFGAFLIDPVNSILIVSPYGAPNQISVYPLAGGAALRSFYVSGNVIQMCPVNTTQFYVLTEQGVLNLCDYAAGDVISSSLLPPAATAGATKINISWDPVRNLLLVFSQVPDNVDGSCASIVRGYFPVPNANRLTVPFPLKPLRKYSTVPFATRLVGDLGRPIAGSVVTADITSTSTDPTPGAVLVNPNAATNGNGYATMSVEGELESTVNLTVSTTQ